MTGFKLKMQKLKSGIFWVISDREDLEDYRLLVFSIPCDIDGNIIGKPKIPLNAKSGQTYNHKKIWEDVIQKNPDHKPYNKKSYDYYPRGRVNVKNNRATVYISPHINHIEIRTEIKLKFGLNADNISRIKFVADGSVHYDCWLDTEN